jgi:mono/diheme cytochrome c family protein
MRALVLILASATALVLAAPAFAAPDPHAAGRKLAQKCAPCHAIGAKDSIKGKAATPFRTLAHKYPLDSLQEALAEGIISGHDDTMPVFKMNPAEIEAFLAYLAAIQR